MSNVTEFRPKSDALSSFVFDTEDDFRAIRLLSIAIQRLMSVRDEDAPIWKIAGEIDEHLARIEDRLAGKPVPDRR